MMRMRREFLSNCVVFFFFPFSCQEMTRKKKRKEKKEGRKMEVEKRIG